MDDQLFISKIHVNNIRNITDLDIPLSSDERKHLIVTGKNGSGKTTLLLAIQQFLEKVFKGQYSVWKADQDLLKAFTKKTDSLSNKQPVDHLSLAKAKKGLGEITERIKSFGGLKLEFKNDHLMIDHFPNASFIMSFFEAKRSPTLINPKGINKVDFKNNYSLSAQARSDFIQHIVNLKAERSFARDDGDTEAIQEIDKWFSNFENQLKDIFEAPSLKLVFNRKK